MWNLAKVLGYLRSRTVEGDVYSLRNPWVLWKRSGTLEFTDGTRFPFQAENKTAIVNLAMFALDNGVRWGRDAGTWRIDPELRVVQTPSGLRFFAESVDPTIFTETFLNDVHFVEFDLRGKVVVEGGAFVGDTALYYAQKGATVYSFEPDPGSCELARRNLELNPDLARSVVLRNWAIGRDGEVDFPVAARGSGGSTLAAPGARSVRVRSVGIGTILSEFRLADPYLLHLDIKGEEARVLEDESLARFQRLRIEYSSYLHAKNGGGDGSLRHMLERLDRLGFGDVRVFKHNRFRFDLRDHGTIDARRKITSA